MFDTESFTNSHQPLAERMRPATIQNFFGQKHLLKPLTRILESEVLPSIIFWGPPGVGKTTLANIIAEQQDRKFFTLNAVSSGVKDVRQVIQQAEAEASFMGAYKKPILFIDEIHRFSKSQQDSLLHAVEKGIICLIGATTENPSFEVISALLSRCQIFILEELTKSDLISVIDYAFDNDEWLKATGVKVKEYDALLLLSGGDARKLLNYLEISVATLIQDKKIKSKLITNEIVESAVQNRLPKYDKNGEYHYDIVSALIKSIRGSDPQAAVYWLARMIQAGEDPKFIARRLLISASEDIGLANPNALLLANSAFQAVSVIGYPESEIILSQLAVYLATSPKSNASYLAIKKANQVIAETGDLSVPLHLRNAPTKLMKELNYGKNYQYSHDFSAKDTAGLEGFGNFVQQEFLPKELSSTKFYEPQNNPHESKIQEILNKLWKNKKK